MQAHMRMFLLVLTMVALVLQARPCEAADVTASFGVGVGGVQILSTRRGALTGRVTLDLVGIHGLTVGARNELAYLFPIDGADKKPSVHNRTTLTAGWAWKDFTASFGVGLSQYTMSACTTKQCAHVSGLAPAADLSLVYFASRYGVQASFSGGWYFGDSAVLNNAAIWMLSLSPVFRIGDWFGGSR